MVRTCGNGSDISVSLTLIPITAPLILVTSHSIVTSPIAKLANVGEMVNGTFEQIVTV